MVSSIFPDKKYGMIIQKEPISGLSVLICCYNAAPRLLPTLKHLALQKLGNESACEIILINNGSTDDTSSLAKNIWKECKEPFSLTIIEEPNPGKMNAIIAGVKAASFNIIVFCDDDNWLREDYLQKAFQLMEAYPEIGLAGGYSEGVTEGQFPEWFSANKQSFAVGRQANVFECDMTAHPMAIWGAGTVSRKILLEKVCDPQFPFLLEDRKGYNIASGGDVEIARRIALLGYRIHYTEALWLWHYMSPHRLNTSYLDSLTSFFPVSFKINRKYFRQWEVANWKPLERYLALIKKLVKYVLGTLSGNQHLLEFSREYLYFLTGLRAFEDDQSRLVRNFYKYYSINRRQD